ncbi:CPBP family intramembrane metalloprotease [Nocardioides sp. ChNu-153]|uniref:CPBP family intramembrane glutamic endopeptidase n=1 Tax=unclassified Nocardioides TaxID=2615069 RepID=UPI0024065B58|nr:MULTISPECIES: CPBP family intramembrane glutamic endopeptidase [unclassified Nocardioides]MDF9716960.1 CPBP family intramembrane metalloprotease [Nocardioides sp. ChNu-99]MDN7122665.1 CPBP family intramembrane metalloprotease [Nocardioides sp. ChNu-153]
MSHPLPPPGQPPGPPPGPPPGQSPGSQQPSYPPETGPVGPAGTAPAPRGAVTLSAEEFAAAYPPLEYHRLHRAGDRGWWRPVVGVVVAAVSMVLVLSMVTLALFALGLAVVGADVGDGVDQMLSLDTVTPLSLAYLLSTLALLTPVVWLVTRYLHGLRPGWTTSVAPRMRWGYFLACAGLSVVALVASLVVSVLVSALDPGAVPEGSEVGSLNAFTETTRNFLFVVLLVTPFQAAGEEYLFRGYVTQVAGGIFSSPRVATAVAIVVPAVLFALAHGAQSPPVFFDRLAFGVMAGYLVIRTGGLEASIAMHVMNNWFAFGLALAVGDMDEVLTPSGGSWLTLPVTLTQTLVYLALAVLVHRGMGLARAADSAVLIGSRGRVYGLSSAPPGA